MKKLQKRLTALRSKHSKIDAQILEYQKDPTRCATVLKSMKSKKLRLKDQIVSTEKVINKEETPRSPELSVIESTGLTVQTKNQKQRVAA